MLQVKSFKFSDDVAINNTLKKFRIAQGASIFVSNGEICIPIEDGEPMNTAQKIIAIKEQKNTMLAQYDIIEHSQQVLNFLKKDAETRVNEAEANLAEAGKEKSGKTKYDKIKQCEQRVAEAKNALGQLHTQYEQNAIEMARLTLNVELFDDAIVELEDKPTESIAL